MRPAPRPRGKNKSTRAKEFKAKKGPVSNYKAKVAHAKKQRQNLQNQRRNEFLFFQQLNQQQVLEQQQIVQIGHAIPMIPMMDQNVIDFWCAQVLQQYSQMKVSDVSSRRKSMRDSWQSRSPLELLNYNEETTQVAYINCDLPYRASFISELMNSHPKLTAMFNKPMVQIVSIGCGPGTEMLGILNFLYQRASGCNSFNPMVRFLLVDKVPEWAKVIRQFETVVRQQTDLVFEATFFEDDLAKNPNEEKNNLSLLPSCRTADIFIFPLIFSEILKQGSAAIFNAVRKIKTIFEYAEPGSIFLVIDIDQKGLMREVSSALNQVFSQENSERASRVFRWSLPPAGGPNEYGTRQVQLGNGCGVITGFVHCLMYTKSEQQTFNVWTPWTVYGNMQMEQPELVQWF